MKTIHQPIEAILFDLGGTLLFPDLIFLREELSREGSTFSDDTFFLAVSKAGEFISTYTASNPKSVDAGRVPVYLRAFLSEMNVLPSDARREAFIQTVLMPRHHAINLWNYVPDGTGELLATLKKKYRLAMISNADGRAEAKTVQFGLREHLEFVIDSAIVGVEKPDKKIFELALAKLNVAPERAVYVGDVYSIDVVGAHAAGLQAILLDKTLPPKTDCVVCQSVFELPEILKHGALV
jgi:putative hydrolase of the HAD superfamily